MTKLDIGSIKIFDTETRFEIAADKAEAFARTVSSNGSSVENGATIEPSSAPGFQRRSKPGRYDDGPRASYNKGPRYDSPRPARDDGPRYKVRSDKGAKLATKPAREITPPVARETPSERPAPAGKPKFNPKDKGKPKYKNREKRDPPADAGTVPRKKPKKTYDPRD